MDGEPEPELEPEPDTTVAEGVPPVEGRANIPVPLSTGATIFIDEWVPGAGNDQWEKLLESIPPGTSIDDWAASLEAFRGSRPMYVETTRFVEPWGSGAHIIKMKAEAGGVYGLAGPCYNPIATLSLPVTGL